MEFLIIIVLILVVVNWIYYKTFDSSDIDGATHQRDKSEDK